MLKRKGLALVVILLFLVILVVLAGLSAVLGTSTQTVSQRAQQDTVWLHAADGALQELTHLLNQDANYGTPSSPGTQDLKVNAGGAYTLSMPGRDVSQTEYWWTFTEGAEPYSTNNLASKVSYTRPDGLVAPAECVLAIVSAGDRAKGKFVRLAAILTDRWVDGIAADSTINMKNSVVRDLGPTGRATVRSNQPEKLPKGDKYAIQVGEVTGDVYTCLDSTLINPDPPGSTWINHGNSPPVDLPNIPIDTIVQDAASSAPYKFNGNVDCDWSGGKLVIGKKPNQVSISPPCQIYVNGSFTYSGSKVLPPGVKLFVKGDVTINGGVSSGPEPTEFSYIFSTGTIRINGASMVHTHMLATLAIQVNGNSHLDGFLYTRQGDIGVTGGGNGSITGVMIARDPDRTDPTILGKVDTSNYEVFTKLAYLEEFRAMFPSVGFKRLYVLSWWRLP